MGDGKYDGNNDGWVVSHFRTWVESQSGVPGWDQNRGWLVGLGTGLFQVPDLG